MFMISVFIGLGILWDQQFRVNIGNINGYIQIQYIDMMCIDIVQCVVQNGSNNVVGGGNIKMFVFIVRVVGLVGIYQVYFRIKFFNVFDQQFGIFVGRVWEEWGVEIG